jgi:signal transduction histidine kinase/HAMP domain-containing protein
MKIGLKSWNKHLTNRLAGTFFIFLFLTVVLVGWIAYGQATQSLTESVFDRLGAVATLKEDGLTRWIDQQRLNIVFTARQPALEQQAGILLDGSGSDSARKAAYAAISDYLNFVVTSVSDSSELFILDLNGRVALSTLPEHEGQSHASDPFFIQGMFTTFIQPVYTSSETGRPTISVSTPLFNENKRRVGILVGHLNLARIDRIFLDRSGLGASGETYLVNPANDFVSAALFNLPDSARPGRIRSTGIDAALLGNSGKGLYTNYQGIPVLGVYLWLDNQGMALMAEMSQEEALSPARQLAWTIFEFGLLAAVLLAGMAFFLARRITRPILAITQVANRVAAGDLSQLAPVLTGDEVGQLAQTFNKMTGQLQLLYEGLENKVAERTAQLNQVNRNLETEISERKQAQERLHVQNEYLAALHETAIGMISRLDLQDLFEALVTRAGQLMHTPDGFIYIAEPGAAQIECKVGVGIFGRLVGVQVAAGEGLGGTVWQTGQPLVVENYDQWPGRVKNLEYDLISSIVGIPLKHGLEVVGVIGLAYHCQAADTHSFGENEIELLGRFAQLASIALDNARLYQVVNEARVAAEAANESKSAFLANVSHELRTPLTSILGFARMVQKRLQERILPLIPAGDPKVQRAITQVEDNLNIVLSEGERLTTLINDLLDLEKIRVGKMVWHMGEIHIGEIVDQAAAATSSLFESKGLTFVQEIPAGLPRVMGDRDRLVQVLINLISNSVKFTPQGAIICRASATPVDLVVCMIDRGIGIAKEDQTLVFEKFRQVGDTLTNKPKGTGLGLPICKEIIEHHGGRMWLESEPGLGSSFYFSLPIMST